MAFAVAELAFGYLNSSTAFLGSIIIGNGINYAIVLMSRYEEHRARGERSRRGAALRRWRGTWRGTLVASIAASAAYASLMVTSFRGFYQFGVMGAVGRDRLLARHVLGAAGDAGAARPARQRRGRARARAPLESRPAGALPARATRGAVTAAFAVLSVVGVVGLRHFLKDPFEYDFRKLNAKLATTEEAQQFNQQPRQPVRPLAVADDRAGRLRSTRSSRSRQAIRRQDRDAAGRRRDRPDHDDLRPAARAARGAAAQAGRCSRRSAS